MKKIRVVTNESFEQYLIYLNRRRKHESRWGSLELDDITSNIKAPTDGEVDASIRELDLVDDIAIKSGAEDVSFGGDGRIRLLDFDDVPSKEKEHPEDDWRLDYDFDDKKGSTSGNDSPISGISSLDFDDDIDTSSVAASIDDVYNCLASDDVKVVKATIKRYAADIKDSNRIRDVLLVHATNLNLTCLRVMCGDMKIVLSAKEKNLGFIDRGEIKNALARFREIASTLTGENNSLGLIPNALVACTPEKQTACINVIDFLKVWCDLPVMPVYVRGSVMRHNYDLAQYFFDEVGGNIPLDIFTGTKGLLNRLKQLDDVPNSLLLNISKAFVKLEPNISMIADFVISCLRSGDTSIVSALLEELPANRRQMIIDYVDDEDAVASSMLNSI